MQQILGAMKDGSITIAVTKKDDYFTITIIPKQNELEPILIEGDLDTVMFDLDNTNLAKAISTATDLEGVVSSYAKAAEKKKTELSKPAPAPAPVKTAASAAGSSKAAPAKKDTPVVTETTGDDDGEVNLFD